MAADIQLKHIVEAALLASPVPLSIDRILGLFEESARPTRAAVREALAELEADYRDRAVELKQIDKAWRFQTRECFAPWLKKLWEGRPPRYSRALLETLAIIAYRQPVTRAEIEEIRGVAVSSEIIKTLLNREWIRQVGHRDIPGRPALFGTTRGFLEHFNLKSLNELPSLPELRDAQAIAAELNLSLELEVPEGGSQEVTVASAAGREEAGGGDDGRTGVDEAAEAGAGAATPPGGD